MLPVLQHGFERSTLFFFFPRPIRLVCYRNFGSVWWTLHFDKILPILSHYLYLTFNFLWYISHLYLFLPTFVINLHVSKSGQEVLIKLVAQALPFYTMSVFLLPFELTTINFEKALTKYWWNSSKDGKNKIH